MGFVLWPIEVPPNSRLSCSHRGSLSSARQRKPKRKKCMTKKKRRGNNRQKKHKRAKKEIIQLIAPCSFGNNYRYLQRWYSHCSFTDFKDYNNYKQDKETQLRDFIFRTGPTELSLSSMEAIKNQIEYYFSDENLPSDDYLLKRIGAYFCSLQF